MTVLLVAVMTILAALSAPLGTQISLAPVPYSLSVPSEVAEHLSTSDLAEPFAAEVRAAGATAAKTILYRPQSGEPTILMTVYYFPADKFDLTKNPDEPPAFGKEIIRTSTHVLSVAGPHDTIYDPDTPDGRNVIAMQKILYEPGTYEQQQEVD